MLIVIAAALGILMSTCLTNGILLRTQSKKCRGGIATTCIFLGPVIVALALGLFVNTLMLNTIADRVSYTMGVKRNTGFQWSIPGIHNTVSDIPYVGESYQSVVSTLESAGIDTNRVLYDLEQIKNEYSLADMWMVSGQLTGWIDDMVKMGKQVGIIN